MDNAEVIRDNDGSWHSLDVRNPLGHTKLNQLDELGFKNWMGFWEGTNSRKDLNHNPDSPGHLYDYRGQYKAGVPMSPDPTDNYMLHGDSRFKKHGHGRSIVEDGDKFLDTRTGQRGSFTDLTAGTKSFNPLGFGQAFTTPGGSTPQYGIYEPSPKARALRSVIDGLRTY